MRTILAFGICVLGFAGITALSMVEEWSNMNYFLIVLLWAGIMGYMSVGKNYET